MVNSSSANTVESGFKSCSDRFPYHEKRKYPKNENDTKYAVFDENKAEL